MVRTSQYARVATANAPDSSGEQGAEDTVPGWPMKFPSTAACYRVESRHDPLRGGGVVRGGRGEQPSKILATVTEETTMNSERTARKRLFLGHAQLSAPPKPAGVPEFV